MDLIVPCAGASTRYPGSMPKYMWPVGNGTMIERTLEGWHQRADRVLFAVLSEHEEEWNITAFLKKHFDCEVLLIPEVTRGQAATVVMMLYYWDIQGSFFVKDSDSAFDSAHGVRTDRNLVCCCETQNNPHLMDLNAKSYLQVNDQGQLVGIVEKQVVSNIFGCGGYHFSDADDFLAGWNSLSGSHELYLSHVIEAMLQNGILFSPWICQEYEDYGTFESWEHYVGRKR